MRVLIVDDEHLALSRLQRLLKEHGIDEVVAFEDPTLALLEATKQQFDACFLDISMPKMDGIELANALLAIQSETFIVFQTAYSEHALEAYNCGALDFLVKPIDNEHIKRVLKRLKQFHHESSDSQKKLLGKRGNRLYLIRPEDIFYIQADLDEVIIRISETDVCVKRKISELQEILASQNFFRIHRSTIINVDRIKSMQSVEQSKLQISFKGIDDVVTSSKDGAKEFREYLETNAL